MILLFDFQYNVCSGVSPVAFIYFVTVRLPAAISKFVVFFFISEPDSLQCQRNSTSEGRVQFVCQVKYKGCIQPKIQWIVKEDGKRLNGTSNAADGMLQHHLTVPAADPSSWPTECHITFPRQSCHQPRSAYTRMLTCPSDDSKYVSFVTCD